MSERQLPAGYASHFVAKKAMFSLMGNAFRIEDPNGGLLFFVKQAAFKIKEDIRVFADEQRQQERLTIRARGWTDFSGVYDVTDSTTGEGVGAAKRHGLASSFVRDQWQLLGADGSEVAQVVEQGGLLATARKFIKVLSWIPQSFVVTRGGQRVGEIQQRFNPFQLAYDCRFTSSDLDPRLGVAIVVLLLAIEGRQE